MGLHQPAVATFDEHESPTATVTMPAPVSLVHSHVTPVPTAGHGTPIPAFDLAALAATTAIEQPRPMDRALAVPVRTTEPATGLDLRSAFLLLHVDGSSCIGEIARVAALPVDEAIAIFLELVAMGSVAFLDSSSLVPPSSGVFSVSIFQEGAATKRR